MKDYDRDSFSLRAQHFVMLGSDRDECRSSEVKCLSYTGLLVTETCVRTSWKG